MLKPVSETVALDLPGQYQSAHPPIFTAPEGFDLNDSLAFTQGQPFEFYKKMREQAPVAWIPIESLTGYWAFTKYDDVRYIETHPQIFSSQTGGVLASYGNADTKRHKKLHDASLNAMICLDQPYHIPLRMQHRSFFSPDYVDKLRDKVEEEVERCLDQMAKAGPIVDLVRHFSTHIPLFTICEILGIEKKDRPKIVHWIHSIEEAGYKMIHIRKNPFSHPIFLMKFFYHARQFLKFGIRELHDRRMNPKEDLLSAIATAELDDEQLSDQYLDGAWLLIAFAGNDTSRNSISGTMRLLTQFPEQKQKLLDDPSKIKDMVQEAIRMVSPVIYMRRTANEDVEFRGQKIAKGEKLVMFYGAVNRDPEKFPNPDIFDIERENAKDHLAFGIGPHVCLGRRIAEMQMQAAYEHILRRFPNITWTGKQVIAPHNFVSAISSLEVDLGI